jgi:hypothetical protein
MKPPDHDSDTKLEGPVSPRWGLKKFQLLATPCVTLALALFALGGSDPTDGFHHRTLSVGRPHDNRGAHFGYGCRIPRCRGCVIQGVWVARKLVFTAPFYNTCKGLPL